MKELNELTQSIHRASLVKRMLQGAVIALTLISMFLLSAANQILPGQSYG